MRTVGERKKLIKRINELKKRKNAVILVHNYQRSEIFDVADFIGDSLQLCKEAAKVKARMILFCGVNFMAESAAILNPDKKVVVPYLDAGCAMADMVDIEELRKFKRKHSDATVVTYVNSTAAVKAESDICCTSSNAVDVVRSVKSKKVIFLPDRNLAAYVAQYVPEKEIIPWQGFCPIHHSLTVENVREIRQTYPNAKLIAHPECKSDVLQEVDYVSSTSGMIKVAEKDEGKDFFVITECGMVDRMKRALPEKNFSGLCNVCFDMKKNTLEAALKALETEKPVVKVDKKVLNRARQAFERMFQVKTGK